MQLSPKTGKSVEVLATVEAVSSDGSVHLRVHDGPSLRPIEATNPAMLEYVRQGTLVRLRTSVQQVKTEGEAGASVFLQPAREIKLIQRRRAARAYVSLPLNATLIESANPARRDNNEVEAQPHFEGEMLQLSPHGFAFSCDYVLTVGDHVTVSFALNDTPLHVSARVVWTAGRSALARIGSTAGRSAGVEFFDLEDAQREHIEEFVAKVS
ncbi:MAG: PilZ domain-containing protein [Myxococcota bacterium]